MIGPVDALGRISEGIGPEAVVALDQQPAGGKMSPNVAIPGRERSCCECEGKDQYR